jgi:uncharacterized repeat protein (TIGR01451 family)
MQSSLKQFKRVGLACVAFGVIAVSQQSLAAGTAASTQINNRATVSYEVSGVSQTPIESSPTGNSTPGANNGANTQFVVDRKIDLVVQEVGAAVTAVTPGAVNQVTTFFLRNDGNDTQGFTLAGTNEANGSTVAFSAIVDAFDSTNVRVFVESTACTGVAQAGLSYVAASDTATTIPTLAADACAFVYVVSDTPITATNGQGSVVRLTATARVPTTLAALTQTAGAETATVVDVVFADTATGGQTARDAAAFADDIYVISAAALSVGKTSTVISDPFNLLVNPKAIPGATVEYAITLTNTGAQPASVVTITDPIPANTTFATGTYNAGASNVQISVGATNTFCVAEAGGTDSNADGCVRTAGGVLTVGSPALTTVATGAGNAVTMRFRVTID